MQTVTSDILFPCYLFKWISMYEFSFVYIREWFFSKSFNLYLQLIMLDVVIGAMLIIQISISHLCGVIACSSASAMKNTPLKLSYVYQCVGCDSFHLQPIGRTITKVHIGYTLALARLLYYFCLTKVHISISCTILHDLQISRCPILFPVVRCVYMPEMVPTLAVSELL